MKLLLTLALSMIASFSSAQALRQNGVPNTQNTSETFTSTVTVTGTGSQCFSVDNPTLVVDCGLHRVGIGDTTPDAQLEVLSVSSTTGYIVQVTSQNAADGGIFAILGNGNVGIGQPLPGAKLQLAASTFSNDQLRFGDIGGTNFWYLSRDNASTGDMAIGSQAGEKIRVQAGGNVGFANTAPKGSLDIIKAGGFANVGASTFSSINLWDGTGATTGGGSIGFGFQGIHVPAAFGWTETNGTGNTAGDFVWYNRSATTDTRPPEILRIFASGTMGFNVAGVEITTATLHVNGSAIFDGNLVQKTLKSCTTGTQTDANGLFSACVASDRKLKKNIVPLDYDPLAIDRLKPVTYYWKDPKPRDAKKHLGFVAQDVEEVYPNAVVSAGTDIKGIDSNAMIAALVIEVQHLRKRVEVLEKK